MKRKRLIILVLVSLIILTVSCQTTKIEDMPQLQGRAAAAAEGGINLYLGDIQEPVYMTIEQADYLSDYFMDLSKWYDLLRGQL